MVERTALGEADRADPGSFPAAPHRGGVQGCRRFVAALGGAASRQLWPIVLPAERSWPDGRQP